MDARRQYILLVSFIIARQHAMRVKRDVSQFCPSVRPMPVLSKLFDILVAGASF